jgi:hypothetical protein
MNIYLVEIKDGKTYTVEATGHNTAISKALKDLKLPESITVRCSLVAENTTLREFKEAQAAKEGEG